MNADKQNQTIYAMFLKDLLQIYKLEEYVHCMKMTYYDIFVEGGYCIN